MAFTSDLVLANNAAASKTFTLQGSPGSTSSSRIETTSISLTDNWSMLIRHQTEPGSKAGPSRDRHTVSFARNEVDSATGIPVSGIITTSIVVPRNVNITVAEVYDLLAYMKNFLTTGNLDKLLRNEV